MEFFYFFGSILLLYVEGSFSTADTAGLKSYRILISFDFIVLHVFNVSSYLLFFGNAISAQIPIIIAVIFLNNHVSNA